VTGKGRIKKLNATGSKTRQTSKQGEGQENERDTMAGYHLYIEAEQEGRAKQTTNTSGDGERGPRKEKNLVGQKACGIQKSAKRSDLKKKAKGPAPRAKRGRTSDRRIVNRFGGLSRDTDEIKPGGRTAMDKRFGSVGCKAGKKRAIMAGGVKGPAGKRRGGGGALEF